MMSSLTDNLTRTEQKSTKTGQTKSMYQWVTNFNDTFDIMNMNMEK